MDQKNLTIGILSTTAVILIVGLILAQPNPDRAYADSMNARGGDYIVTTGQLQANEEVLYVINASTQQMVAYQFDINRMKIVKTAVQQLKSRGLRSTSKPASRGSGSSRRGTGRR